MPLAGTRPLKDPIKFHDDLAEAWNAKYLKGSFRSRSDLIRQLLTGVDLSGQLWLDAGCGTGTLACLLAQRGCNVLGIDASRSMVQQARKLWPQLSDHLDFEVVETIERLPFEDSRFAGVLCSSVVEYLDDPIACCRELNRVLKPHGRLLLSVPNQRSLFRQMQKGLFHLSRLVLSSPVPTYLALSKNEYSLPAAQHLLTKCEFTVLRHGFCGLPQCGPIRKSSRLAPLLFILAEKRRSDSNEINTEI